MLDVVYVPDEDADMYKVQEGGYYGRDDDGYCRIGPYTSAKDCRRAIREAEKDD